MALDILPETYHVKLKDMPHEFFMQQTEPVLRVVTTFLESFPRHPFLDGRLS